MKLYQLFLWALSVLTLSLYPLSYVTSVTALSVSETQYVTQRLSYVQGFLERSTTTTCVSRVPKVAVCISGGGLRAMIGGLGFLQAMEENGLLELTTYVCTLSGSTWALSGWLQSGTSLAVYREFIKPGLQAGLLYQVNNRAVVQELAKKVKNDQSISLDDIWGSLIAQKILSYSTSDQLIDITLDNYRKLPTDGSLPLPLYNCVTPLEDDKGQNYQWVEWTPYDIRCPFLKTAIPLARLGSSYTHGMATSLTSPLSLSFGQGVWGSAISADVQDILASIKEEASGYEELIIEGITHMVETYTLLNDLTCVRALPARLPNWNYKMQQAVLADTPTLTFVDAGLLCNLPVPPLLEPLRAVDIIIVVDLTLEADNALELACMQAYAQRNGLPFPAINSATLNAICSVHPGQRSSGTPTIIYFPMVANPAYNNNWNPLVADFTSTFNLTYTPEQVDLVSGLMYTACQQYYDTIWSVIRHYL